MRTTITRRDFLVSGLAAAGTGIIVPPVLARSVFAATVESVHNDRVLVVLQMGGGNDGLNTVVPYTDPAYVDARPGIAVQPQGVLQLSNSLGLNPVLKGIKSLYDAGRVAVVQGVGYANPTYSHFEGMYVWQHADPAREQTDGWLGKLLAAQLDSQGHPLTGCALAETSTPPEMLANRATVSVIDSIADYRVDGPPAQQALAPALYRGTPGVYGVLFDQALSTAESGISALQSTASEYRAQAQYPAPTADTGGSISASLQLTAELIVTQPSVKICHVVLGGFDTHENQTARQNALLTDVDAAVSAFMSDLDGHGQADRVLLMTWSEFGRRIYQNGSAGTDHGAAAPVFLMGAPVRGGVYGETPSLTHTIDSGNLQYTVDFRSVYQSVIRDWLQADPGAVLGGAFPELPLIRQV